MQPLSGECGFQGCRGGEGRGEQVTPAIQPSQRGPSGIRGTPQWVLRCPDSSLLCKGKVPVLSTGVCFPPLLPGPRRAPLRESVAFAQQGEAEILEVAGKGAARGVFLESQGTPISMRSRGQRSASSLEAAGGALRLSPAPLQALSLGSQDKGALGDE